MQTPCAAPVAEPAAESADDRASGVDHQRILATQLNRLAEASVWCQYGWVLLGGLVAGVFSGVAPKAHILGFLGLDLAGVALLGLLANRIRRQDTQLQECDRWGRLCTLTSLVIGSTWGAAGVFLFTPESAALQTFLALAIVGMAAISASCLSWHLPTFLAFVVTSVVPMSLHHLVSAGPLEFGIGMTALVYLVMLIGLGWSLNRRFADFIAREIEDESLIERLLTGRASENAVQARLETALESMSEGLAVFDADDRLVICNRRFFGEQQAGRAPDITGRTFEELVRWDVEKPAVQRNADNAGIVNAVGREDAYIAERLAYHRRLVGTFEVERSDGRWFQIRDRRTADGGTVIVQTDITAYKRAEEKLRAAKEKAERASRSKSELLANTSHELRTPLNAIIGFSELMESQIFGQLGSERYLEYARDIRKSGEYLTKIIDDLLDLSKIEAGRLDPAEGTVDLEDTLRTVLNITQKQARARHLTIEVDIAPDLPYLRADPRMFQQILLNLLSNAVKFTLENGRVEISMYVDRNGDLVIEITDTGIGMSPEDLEHAMEPFGRAGGAMIRNFEGTGLGLPLSRSLVQLHEGTLELESEPSIGTVARVRIPAARVISRRRAVGA